MSDRYPGYDVLAKRLSPSWNAQTRAVIEERLALAWEPHFFSEQEWNILIALCDCVVPRPGGRPRLPAAVLVDRKMAADKGDGYRDAGMPPMQEAWRWGLRALNAEAQRACGQPFFEAPREVQQSLVKGMQDGAVHGPEWEHLPPALFFRTRVIHDIVAAYYAFPQSWDEIGFGGPASPRGYVRMGFNERDPWEAIEGPLAGSRHAG